MAENKISTYDPGKEPKNPADGGSQKEAENIRNLWLNANTGKRMDWEEREQKSYDFALNEQLTQEEKDMLIEAGMPDFIINRITPIIETMKYFITSNRPRFKAVGKDGSDSRLAQIHQDVIEYAWYVSNGQAVFSQVINNVLAKSKGYFHIVIDPDADRGLGEVKIESVDPWDVWVCENSSDPYERDASFQIIKKDLSRTELKHMYPEYEDIIDKAQGEQDSESFSNRDMDDPLSIQKDDLQTPVEPEKGESDDWLPYYEVYRPKKMRFYNLFMQEELSEAEMRETRAGIDASVEDLAKELAVELTETQEELRKAYENEEINEERLQLELEKAEKAMKQELADTRQEMLNTAIDQAQKVEQRVVTEEEYEELIKNKDIKEKIVNKFPFYETRIQRCIVVGNKYLYDQILDITSSPLIAIPYMHTGTPYPMSAVSPLVGKQREINKAHQIMIHNANLSSNLRWKYVEGEIDTDVWAQNVSAPSALLPYRPGFSSEGPKEILPQNINNAFFTIEQDAKTDMEYIAGIQPPSMGISTSAEETYRGFLAQDEYGTRRIRSWVNNVLEPGLEHLGKIFQEYAKNIYSVNKVFRIVQPLSGGDVNVRESEINIPIYDSYTGEEIARKNDYQSSRYDVRIISGSTLPINRWAVLEEKKDWLQMGVIDDIAFIKETDLPDKEAIIQRKSMLSQLQGKVEQLEEQVKDRDGTIETLMRQIIQAEIRDKVMQAQIEIDRSKTELKAANKMAGNELKRKVSDALKTGSEPNNTGSQKKNLTNKK